MRASLRTTAVSSSLRCSRVGSLTFLFRRLPFRSCCSVRRSTFLRQPDPPSQDLELVLFFRVCGCGGQIRRCASPEEGYVVTTASFPSFSEVVGGSVWWSSVLHLTVFLFCSRRCGPVGVCSLLQGRRLFSFVVSRFFAVDGRFVFVGLRLCFC